MAEEEMLAEMRRMQEKITKCKQGIREMQAVLDLWEMNYANTEMEYRKFKENKKSASLESSDGGVAQISTTSATASLNSSGRYDASLVSSEPAVSATLSRPADRTAENIPQLDGKHQAVPEPKISSSETPVETYSSKASGSVASALYHQARVQSEDNPLLSFVNSVRWQQEAEERAGKRDINVDKATGGTPVHFKQNADKRTFITQQNTNYNAVSNTEPTSVQQSTSGASSAMLSTALSKPKSFQDGVGVILSAALSKPQSLPDSVNVNQGPKLDKAPQAVLAAPAQDVQSRAGALGLFTELSGIKEDNEEDDVSSDEEAGLSKQISKRLKRAGEGEGRRENKYLEQVKLFLETKKEEIQKIFKGYERQYEKNPILCEKTDKGNYKISPEQRRQYNLPRGIQGTQARHGQQNFNILLHNVVLSGVKLGLQGEHVNFVDPRDAAEVLKQVQTEYENFLEEIKQQQ